MKTDGTIYLYSFVTDPPRASVADRAPHRAGFVRHNADGSSEVWEGTLTVDELWGVLKDRLNYERREAR